MPWISVVLVGAGVAVGDGSDENGGAVTVFGPKHPPISAIAITTAINAVHPSPTALSTAGFVVVAMSSASIPFWDSHLSTATFLAWPGDRMNTLCSLDVYDMRASRLG